MAVHLPPRNRNLMKKRILTLLLATLSLPALAQTPQGDVHERMGAMAVRYGDYNVAIQALYHALAEQPTSLVLKDSLASLYFMSRQYVQAINVAQEVVGVQPNNAKMRELLAVSFANLGQPKASLEQYEALFSQTGNIRHLYQIAGLQLQLTRLAECAQSLNAIISSELSATEKVLVPVNERQQQEVILRAAAYNIYGLLAQQNKEYQGALQNFDAALQLQEDFVAAQLNKNRLMEAMKQAQNGGE